MQALNRTKRFLLYLKLICCGLLLVSVYFLHDKGLPMWMLSSNITETNNSTTLDQYSQNINEHTADINAELQLSNRENNVHINRSKEEASTNNQNDFSDQRNPFLQSESSTGNSQLQNGPTKSYIHQNASDRAMSAKFYQDAKNLLIKNEVLKTNDSANLSTSADIQSLGETLERKLNVVALKTINQFKPTCVKNLTIANSCDNNACLQTELPESPTERVAQLVTPRKLQLTPEEHTILREMANKINGNYDIILLTATSSNHFRESIALFKNLHENVYPYLNNFTTIAYNIGLTQEERALMVKHCKCQVLDFPFDKFPTFMRTLNCYSWKPIAIKAQLQNANIIFWMDSSVRFHKVSATFHTFIRQTRERGVQIGSGTGDSTFRTFRSMYHFFGDEPCAYLSLDQASAGIGVYHREYFVDRVILEPWVACAVKAACMCPDPKASLSCANSIRVANEYYHRNGALVYGLCHRNDQSAISVILHKLYQELYTWVMVNIYSVLNIRRGDELAKFPNV